MHDILLLIAACYAVGRIINVAFEGRLRVTTLPTDQPIVVPHRTFVGGDAAFLSKPLRLADTFMAGAGAIGNGVALSLSLLNVSGELAIVDPDNVSNGNLNRCVLFKAEDVDAPKATRLAEILGSKLNSLEVSLGG